MKTSGQNTALLSTCSLPSVPATSAVSSLSVALENAFPNSSGSHPNTSDSSIAVASSLALFPTVVTESVLPTVVPWSLLTTVASGSSSAAPTTIF